ncbi:MAG: hypothetical protein IKM23_01785 [Bacteroidales bacterium]|nr:hypothetical protein [Bacteroidales bacterium]
MKKLSLIALALLAVVFTSCDGLGGEEENKIDKSQIVGKWMTADSTYFEVYNSDGTGKSWDLKDDVNEDEAQKFTWEFDEGSDDKFFQYQEMEIGGVVPQYCNILELTSTTFKYNNEAMRATYNLVRAE